MIKASLMQHNPKSGHRWERTRAGEVLAELHAITVHVRVVSSHNNISVNPEWMKCASS